VAVLGALVLSYASARGEVQRGTAEVERLQQEVGAAEQRVERLAGLQTTRDRLGRQLADLEPARARRYQALELMRSLSEGAAGEIVLSNFSLKPDQPLLIHGSGPDPTAVADLQAFLTRSPRVSSVTLDRVDRFVSPTAVAARRVTRGKKVLESAAPEPVHEAVNFTMTVHLWTERIAKGKRSALRAPGAKP
jgi:hypothetical protein